MGVPSARLATAALAFLFVASGCVESPSSQARERGILREPAAPAPPGFPVDWAELVVAGDASHSHRDYTQHVARSTANFEVLGYDPLITDYTGRTAGGHSCHDTREHNGARLTAVHSINNDVAFILVNVTDPANPKKVGELVMDNTQVYDIGMTPDQRYVILGTTPFGVGPGNAPTPIAATWRDACDGTSRPVAGPESSLPFSPGLVVVDIANPRNPVIMDFLMYPVTGGHSVRVADIGGQIFILTAVTGGPGYYALAQLTEAAGRPKLVPHSFFKLGLESGGAPTDAQVGGHDGFIQKHPVTGARLAYLGYGSGGLVIVNIDDPRNPRLVSRWNDWAAVGGPDASHFFHGTLPMAELWDARHYTFGHEECGGHPPKTPTCLAYAFDTTDPAKPTLVGAWTLPVDVQWQEAAQFSTHYLEVQNRTLFIAMYHAGLWAIDVSTPEAIASMPSIGAFLPDRASPKPPPTIGYGAPAVLDVTPLSDGSLVVTDRGAGLYTVRFDAANPAPAPSPWPVIVRP